MRTGVNGKKVLPAAPGRDTETLAAGRWSFQLSGIIREFCGRSEASCRGRRWTPRTCTRARPPVLHVIAPHAQKRAQNFKAELEKATAGRRPLPFPILL